MDNKTIEFLQKLKDSGNWNDEYDYSKVEYIYAKTKVLIIDKKFNTEHLIRPSSLLNGSKCCIHNLIGEFYSYDKCKEFINNLNIKTQREWQEYCKSDKRPHSIPSHPNGAYKDSGWISWSHFLNSDNISSKIKANNFLSYNNVKEFIKGLNIKTQREWVKYAKSGNRPDNIPNSVQRTYKKSNEWISWQDFLGSDNISNSIKKENYINFDDAKVIIHKLNLKTSTNWRFFVKSGNKPDNIPSEPNKHYKYDGWLSWGDFLGSKIGFDGKFLPYKDAIKIVHKLKIKNISEWWEYCTSDKKPYNIPSSPNNVYKEFTNYIEWLGVIGNGTHNWTKNTLIHFIKSIQDELVGLDSIELITIINSNNLSKKIKEVGLLEDLISSKVGSEKRRNILKDIIDKFENKNEDEFQEDFSNDVIEELEFINGLSYNDVIDEDQLELKPVDPIQELRIYDNEKITASLDDENLDFLMKNQLKKIWNAVLNRNDYVEEFRTKTGGDNFTIIKNWFFEEYEKVIQIKCPDDYIFEHQPNLMQKLITYRLINEKRYGNWSGTGAGKTLSAIFAGRYAMGVKNTIIVCNNASVEGWVKSINEYFSNNKVYTKKVLNNTDEKLYSVIDDKYDVNFNKNDNNYLILNYETFQLEDGELIVSNLLENNFIDYIILDEVQNVKQRDEEKESIRRSVVGKLLAHSKEINENLLVLAMSATPITNNLTEPKKLIELLTGKLHDELNTADNILNGIEMYKALTRYGLRYKPDYGISVNKEFIEIDGEHLSQEIIKVPKGSVTEFEKVLLKTKLDGIKDKIKKGTLIYTHYVTDLCKPIGDYVENLGFSIGYYTGGDKNGLDLFKRGKIDVLIGSSPVATGVDGIQDICNTLIPIVLPWTSSEYDQLIGRINRQGGSFDHVNIYIPQVTIQLGGEGDNVWSWDKRRYNIIEFKSSLAHLAVDGTIPDKLIPTHEKLVEEAQKELSDWINRLQAGNIITFEREEFFKIPFNNSIQKQIDRSRNKLGDFSEINKSWCLTISDNTHERLSKNNEEWYKYHKLYSERRKTWLEIPFVEIAKKINARPEWIVGDFGCGENLLSKEINNKVHAFDHVAIDDSVIVCDIKNVPLDDNVLDVAVFSLSLMGLNYVDYLKEAYRTLKPYGCIFICEPGSKWADREDELKVKIESVGFKCHEAVKHTDKFIYIDGMKY
jgi:superfamily II DNA or RNA helicase